MYFFFIVSYYKSISCKNGKVLKPLQNELSILYERCPYQLSYFFFLFLGITPIVLAMMPSITSSAPPPILCSLKSLYILLIETSLVNPIPPQYCRHSSGIFLQSFPDLYLHMEASCVTSLPSQ